MYGTTITGDIDNQADLQAAFDDLFVEYGVSPVPATLNQSVISFLAYSCTGSDTLSSQLPLNLHICYGFNLLNLQQSEDAALRFVQLLKSSCVYVY